jgi:hypothetical protein
MEPEYGLIGDSLPRNQDRNGHASESLGVFGARVIISATQPTHIAKSRTTLPIAYIILHTSVISINFVDRTNPACRE